MSAWTVLLMALTLLGAVLAVGGCGGRGGLAKADRSPAINSLATDAPEVLPDGSCTLTCSATDPENDDLTFDWSCGGGTISGSGASVSWTAPDTPGTCTVTVSVSDGTSAVTSTMDIEVVNDPPTVSEASVSPSELQFAGGTVTIAAKATDDAGVAEVSATITEPSGTCTVPLTASGGHYEGTYVAAGNAGTSEDVYGVEVKATDAHGAASAAMTLSFAVKAPPAPPDRPWQ